MPSLATFVKSSKHIDIIEAQVYSWIYDSIKYAAEGMDQKDQIRQKIDREVYLLLSGIMPEIQQNIKNNILDNIDQILAQINPSNYTDIIERAIDDTTSTILQSIKTVPTSIIPADEIPAVQPVQENENKVPEFYL